ncbi:type II toxin-antitoxin system RelE/ParE family toxin [Polyangium sp. 6x1]|uniref:type II toxin-antitoxin system RelE/ParE family toxin n=1 Tax=Polyangium sp. 6x1 TaxID=3042689 RepID=UPI0024827719|nr:type II toxin-antitoxin system RelE/ParE family toxin [Polyangium sp. 6x1]MDI1447860.1 type II toxin-antitoxin system RelE/ParE family toxin [Polyangium sp. 6x1]
MTALRIGPEAEVELREAAAWYKERSPEVARRFLREVRTLTKVVARMPLRFPVIEGIDIDPPVRRALVAGFPYAMVFIVADDVVHILAIAHQQRMPGYWRHRLGRDE